MAENTSHSSRSLDSEELLSDYQTFNGNVNGGSDAKEVHVVVYSRRWYVLAVFSSLVFVQCLVWNTWAPIAASTSVVFGWDNSNIALLTNWGCLMFILTAPFFTWLMDVKGLRLTTVLVSGVIFAGTGLRCITSEQPYATYLINAGQILNGLGGPFVMAGAPLVSVLWFPVNQRTTATALGTITASIGVAVSNVIGPQLVPALDSNLTECLGNCSVVGSNANVTVMDIRNGIMILNYLECGIAGLVFLVIIAYFPSKPPHPPSLSAHVERVDYGSGLKMLLRYKTFWLMGTACSLVNGVYIAWGGLLFIILSPRGVSQTLAGWVGFYSIIAGSLIAPLVARFADIYVRRIKSLIVVMYVCSIVVCLVFALLSIGIIPMNTVLLYVCVLGLSVLFVGAQPLFFEMVCEATHPIAEGLTTGLLAWYNNVISLLFYGILMIPSVGTDWMNWTLLGSLFFSIPLLVIAKESYSRLDVDTRNKTNTKYYS